MKKYLLALSAFLLVYFLYRHKLYMVPHLMEEMKEEVLLLNLYLPTNNLTVAKSFESFAPTQAAAYRQPYQARMESYMA
jgi:hypothetical protein